MDHNIFTEFATKLVPYIEDLVTAFIILMYRVILPIMGLGLFIAKFTPTMKDDIFFQKIIGIFRKNKEDLVDAKQDAGGKDPDLFDK